VIRPPFGHVAGLSEPDRVSRAWRCGMRAMFVASVFAAGFSAGYYGARLHGYWLSGAVSGAYVGNAAYFLWLIRREVRRADAELEARCEVLRALIQSRGPHE
jgi:hypothetical protein